jgi:lysyl-tRNA synthetase class 1
MPLFFLIFSINIFAAEVLEQPKKIDALEQVYSRASQLALKIRQKSDKLKSILVDYQTRAVTDYEIERSISTLQGLHYNEVYFTGGKIDDIAVMLPSNLPLYSLILFGVIPSLLSKNISIRPNSLLQEHDIISRIHNELELGSSFSNIEIVNCDHEGFKPYIKNANLVVFTGRPSNAEKILLDMKIDSMLVINGSGHNPVVVTETADIEKAIEGSLFLKSFNGGQDCGGPDAILVHQNIAEKFISEFNTRFRALKVGPFSSTDTVIGPIKRFSELQKFATIFNNNNKDIVSGGLIDFKDEIVYPTTIVRSIERHPNYKEVFGPVAFIHPYKKDADLSCYFQDIDGQYNANRMYVTVYGYSDFLSQRDDSIAPTDGNVGILLKNQTIHDVEIGYKPYGGFSLAASGIIKKTSKGMTKLAMPILIPQIIYEYLINKTELSVKIKDQKSTLLKSVKSKKEIDPIVDDFRRLTNDVFNENLVFGFIFGSAAKSTLKNFKDDIDTFICIKHLDAESCAKYIHGLALLHNKYDLLVDHKYPAEIVIFDDLIESVEALNKINVSIKNTIQGKEFDRIFWAHALTDKKIGFIGEQKIMSEIIYKAQPHIYRWRDQILAQLAIETILPSNLASTFSGLSKEEVIAKLSKYNAHLIVHLALNWDDGKNK